MFTSEVICTEMHALLWCATDDRHCTEGKQLVNAGSFSKTGNALITHIEQLALGPQIPLQGEEDARGGQERGAARSEFPNLRCWRYGRIRRKIDGFISL